MQIQILHNPRCKKSRDAVEYLESNELPHIVIKYLESPLCREELEAIIQKLGVGPQGLVRKKEKIYREMKLDEKTLTDKQWINLLFENPKLIERPIVIKGAKAVIGRPLENVIEFLT
jgi:arsenate reductase